MVIFRPELSKLYHNFQNRLDLHHDVWYTGFMIDFDLDLTKKLLTHLGYLAKTSVQLYDENFVGTYACTSPGNKLCQMVKCHYADRCNASDSYAMQKITSTQEDNFHYSCHFGMREMVFKLHRNNVIYGYILIGPLRDTRAEKHVLHQISDYCREFGLDEKEMRDKYYKTARFSQQKFEALKELTYAVFEYAINKNLISLRTNMFENAIAPYIKNNLDQRLDAQSLCKALNMSEKQIYTATTKATGQSPKKYITSQRMQAAKNLIETTDEPLTVVAIKVGIPDYNYFGKIFKATFGHSPNYFKRK